MGNPSPFAESFTPQIKGMRMLCLTILPTLLLLGTLFSTNNANPFPPADDCSGRSDGESFTAADGCNTCVCRNGRAACTMMFCPPPRAKRAAYPGGYPAVDTCSGRSDGESFTAADGCNTCVCSNGMAACTMMLCPPGGFH